MLSLHRQAMMHSPKRRQLLWLAPIIALCLLLAQSVDLVHNHDGELDQRFDCEICLKLGSNAVAAVTADFSFDLSPDSQAVAGKAAAAPFIALPAPRSRAPPLV